MKYRCVLRGTGVSPLRLRLKPLVHGRDAHATSMLHAILIMISLLIGKCVNAAPTTQPYLLHLPGIGGHLPIDDHLILGLQDGGVKGWLEIHDWTGPDRGLMALLQEKRHQEESTFVSQLLARKIREYPGLKITLTSHSGGCGIAAWALEKLPDGVMIDTWVQMQSALSPEYDLSKALSHVKHAYAFYSELDTLVLGTGTRNVGTIDGVKSESAGKTGYVAPDTADLEQYRKLTQFIYEESWMRYGDVGDHIGPMNYRFARFMIAPLLKTGILPKPAPLPHATTQPTTAQSPG
jgi:hypothetical protein